MWLHPIVPGRVVYQYNNQTSGVVCDDVVFLMSEMISGFASTARGDDHIGGGTAGAALQTSKHHGGSCGVCIMARALVPIRGVQRPKC